MANLPEEFLEDIREILQDEYDDFIKSYDEDKTTGLRINTLKIDKKIATHTCDFSRELVAKIVSI
ncbi:hypothetical protein KW94_02795 [Clostridioides difficile]|nr:hypothetical protein KW94_02795 [Clostridioides difficile]